MEFWGTLIIGVGCCIAGITAFLMMASVKADLSIPELLGFEDAYTGELWTIAGIIIGLFFVVMGFFVKGSARDYEKPPEIEELGGYQQTNEAPEIDTPEELAPKQAETLKQVLPEVNKTTEQRDKEVNDYVQEAIRRNATP